MGLLWFDGFGSYNNSADINVVANPLFSTTGDWNSVISGRRGGRGLWGHHSHFQTYTFVNNYASILTGIAIRQGNVGTPSYHADLPLLGFYDGSTLQIGVYVVGTELHVYNGSGVKLGETSGANIAYNVWRYVEAKVVINNSTGIVVIRVDENVLLNLSSQDTQNSANAYLNKITLRGIYSSLAITLTDLYFCDLTGDAPHNDFLGDIRIDILRPNAAGTYTDFTPSAGSNHENVDETYGPDDDVTYNDGANIGDQDSYQMPDLPSPAGTTIYGVKTQGTVRKTDAGAMKCKLLTRAGTTDDLGEEIALSDSYTTHAEILEDNPDDSAAWEDADVNSMEPGVEITA